MTAYDVEPGDSVHPGNPVKVDRYSGSARINHWITATCLVLLALSRPVAVPSRSVLPHGLVRRRAEHARDSSVDRRGAVFQLRRPVLSGSAANLWVAEDGTWLARIKDVMTKHEDRLPDVGKYNAGQKAVFWGMSLLILTLIVSGVGIWDTYFADYTNVETKRIAVLIHSAAAVVIICVWIVHVYCRDLGARHHRRHDARPGHWRLGVGGIIVSAKRAD